MAEEMGKDAKIERLITVAILAEEHVSAAGAKRGDGTRGGRLLEIIDRALGRPSPAP